MPEGSVLEPLLLKILMCNLLHFIIKSSIAHYADDTTIYKCETSLA